MFCRAILRHFLVSPEEGRGARNALLEITRRGDGASMR